MDNFVIDLTDPSKLTGSEITRALVVLMAEQQERAIANADPVALIEQGFELGFDSKGLPKDPWVVQGILVAPGAKVDKSAMSHNCAFARVGPSWVWEHEAKIEDSVRYIPGARQQMRSVTLIALNEGDAIDLIASRTRSGVHELTGVRSFVYEADALDLVSARTVRADNHR